MQIIKAYEKACGKEIPYQIVERRPGDIATCYADTNKAKQLLDFTAQYDLDRMCIDTVRFNNNLK